MGKFAVHIVVVFSLCLMTACGKSQSGAIKEAPLLPPNHYGDSVKQAPNRAALISFITNKLSGNDGTYTNYIDTEQSAEAASGHEVLSESAGLLMRYYAMTKQQDAFDSEWARAKRLFDLKYGFSYRFSPKQSKSYQLNAAVDDLRIIRALHEAGEVFKDAHYTQIADEYGSRFYMYNVKDGYLYDFYDEIYQLTNDFITLCYIDLKSLQLLPLSSKEKKTLMNQMTEITRNGYLSDAFPFYETRYTYASHAYSSEKINTVESMLTILALSEVGLQQTASISYLKEHVKNGTLYGQYTKDGAALTEIESTAIYAIAAMIAAEIGDKSLYEDSMEQMNQFRIVDASSKFQGGFADEASGQAYSFDNLMALLAYAY
ncbi:hypothetical protein [Paenibacillus sinopodophylli]|uniref:hypothetical protein n=1 Tax=Paenibacillus sinopodophylli TaxID=1837342 RepID=UPI00110CBF9B|nr:hypothetical protein [Paenibacillus sinopodophylli]